MTHSTNPINNLDTLALTDDEMLDILRRVQSGELSVAQAEALLGAAFDEHQKQRSLEGPPDGQNFSAPLGKIANGKLVFERGAAGLSLQAEVLPEQLFTARFERHIPVVRVNGGTVTVRYRDFGFGLLNWLRYGFNPPQSEMTLNAAVPWQIEIHGGMAQSYLDLRTIKLRRLTIHSGASDIKLMLGQPNGGIKVECHGGVHNLIILRPATVAAHLTVHGGAANLTLDSQTLGAVGSMTSLETSNFREASDYYAITIHGGAHNFRVATL
ncbi:MAG: hypothetical protein L6R45_20595 [Anaerolineae bacterium]|nr:hypothetical protein [Anaerolineae bacterium]